jgi:hypothetical protein
MPRVYLGDDTVASQDEANKLTTGGDAVMPRWLVNVSTNATGSGNLRLTCFTARLTRSTTQVRFPTGNTAAGATPTLVRVGLYIIVPDTTVNAVPQYTLVAAIANDTTLMAAANTDYTRSWTAAYQLQAGQRYALGLLVVTAAAAPTVCGYGCADAAELAMAPRLTGQLAGQSDLPATFADTALAASGSSMYAALL